MTDQKKPQPTTKNTERKDQIDDLPAKKVDGKQADEVKGGFRPNQPYDSRA